MAIRRWRIALLLVGLALLAVGGVVLLQDVDQKRYLGILLWLAGALVVHDGIIAPVVFLVSIVLRKTRLPTVVVLIVQGALAVGGIVSLLVLPEIVKKALGTLSSSILPQDYVAHLAVFWAALVVLAALAIAFYAVLFRHRARPRD
jgi:hypothetical protein